MKAKNLTVPTFKTEAEEAAWWDEHIEEAEENLLQTIEKWNDATRRSRSSHRTIAAV